MPPPRALRGFAGLSSCWTFRSTGLALRLGHWLAGSPLQHRVHAGRTCHIARASAYVWGTTRTWRSQG